MVGERRAALDALVVVRRLLLVLVAGIVVVVGAMTADHIEIVSTPGNDSSLTAVDVRNASDVTTESSMLTVGDAGKGIERSTADLVLLTCSIVALFVLIVPFFRAGPTAGSPKRRSQDQAIPLPPAHIRMLSDGPDRLALCVSRT